MSTAVKAWFEFMVLGFAGWIFLMVKTQPIELQPTSWGVSE